MALTLADLESDRRRNQLSVFGLPPTSSGFGQGAPPPPAMRIRDIRPQNPSAPATFDERYRGAPPDRGTVIEPGTPGRFMDESKVYASATKVPPSLGTADRPRAQSGAIPEGFEMVGGPAIPEGFELVTGPNEAEAARSAAARRTQLSVTPMKGRQEGAATRAIVAPGERLARELGELGEDTKAVLRKLLGL